MPLDVVKLRNATDKLQDLMGASLNIQYIEMDEKFETDYNYVITFLDIDSFASQDQLKAYAQWLISKGLKIKVPDFANNLLRFYSSLDDILAIPNPSSPSLEEPGPVTVQDEMIVLFLDIDGVLSKSSPKEINEQVKKKGKGQGPGPLEILLKCSTIELQKATVDLFDKSALKALDCLIEAIQHTNKKVGIVISSNWRENRSVLQLQNLFRPHNFAAFIINKIIEPDDSPYITRAQEIQAWLQENQQRYNIINFAILDDVDYAKTTPHLGMSALFGNKFILCNSELLFGMKECSQALKALGILKLSSSDKEASDHKMAYADDTAASGSTIKTMKAT